MLFPFVVFFLSLSAIIGLFALRLREENKGIVYYPKLRDRADAETIVLKERLTRMRIELARLPPEAMHLARIAVHIAALKAAAIAHYLEAQANRLADLASHKHRFERRDTQSEFLKKMQDYALHSAQNNGPSTNSRPSPEATAGTAGQGTSNGKKNYKE